MPTGFGRRSFASALADRVDPPPVSELESPYLPGYPPSDRQEEFVALDCLEAFYGGAAGGGKSDAMLRAALKYVHVPGYSALLLRRSYAELSMPGGLMHRSKLWLTGTDAKWSGSGGDEAYTWRFPSTARIVFGHAETERAILRYYGSEWQCIEWDELTHFPEAWYKLLFSRLRRPQTGPLSEVPLRMRGASNPGGPGHHWVKRRLIKHEPDPDDIEDTPEKCAARIFVPAKLDDNPGIDRVAYRRSLGNLDPQQRAQLEDGDWDARPPGPWVFDGAAIDAAVELGTEYDRLRSLGEMTPPVDHAIQNGVDWGDFASAAEPIWPLERGGIYVPPGEVATSRSDVEDIALQILAAMAQYPYWFSEERYDSSFAQSNRTFVRVATQALGQHNMVARSGRPNTYPVHFNKYKLLAVRYIRLLLRRTLEAKEAGWPPGEKLTRLLAISPKAVRLIEQMRDYQEDEQDKFEKGNDDHVDALIAGVTPVARKHRAVVEKEIAEAKRKAALAQPQKPVSTPPGATERLETQGG
jgi:Terminase large subunit, T4likevirus-type, N-terminal